MGARARYDEESLGTLLTLLRPVPEAWVTAASELPGASRGLEQVLALAEADAEFRRELIEDLEAALARAGVEPRPGLVRELRQRLSSDPGPDA